MRPKYPYLILALLLLTGCSTIETLFVHAPSGTMIYTPDDTVTPDGYAVDFTYYGTGTGCILTVPSDMYCGYILVQSAGSDIKVPIGLDYKTNSHIGAKAALYAGVVLGGGGAGAGVGGMIAASAASVNDDEESESVFGKAAAFGMLAALVGVAIGMPAESCLQQTSYDYNFGYEKEQIVKMPTLSPTLLNPNNPKGYEAVTPPKELSSSRKASSFQKADELKEGDTGEGNYSQAVYTLRKAAEQGNVDAQLVLGSMYYSGEGVTRDYSKAVYWLRKAAEQGNADAQCNLGGRYYLGEGVTQDYSQAVYWWRKAAAQGNESAQMILNLMEKAK